MSVVLLCAPGLSEISEKSGPPENSGPGGNHPPPPTRQACVILLFFKCAVFPISLKISNSVTLYYIDLVRKKQKSSLKTYSSIYIPLITDDGQTPCIHIINDTTFIRCNFILYTDEGAKFVIGGSLVSSHLLRRRRGAAREPLDRKANPRCGPARPLKTFHHRRPRRT